MARAVVQALKKMGEPYLINEDKMIKASLFPRLTAARKQCKFCEFYFIRLPFTLFLSQFMRLKLIYFVVNYSDVVCEAQAHRWKAVLEASRKEATSQHVDGVTPDELEGKGFAEEHLEEDI